MPSKYLTCRWCKNEHVPRGAYVCRECGSKIYYGATDGDLSGVGCFGFLLGILLPSLISVGIILLLAVTGIPQSHPLRLVLVALACGFVFIRGLLGWVDAEDRVKAEKADQVTWYEPRR